MEVKARILEYNKPENGYSNSNIEIEIDNTTFHFMNMLRRVLKTYIPTYAFSPDKIKITKNSSIINNDQMRERLSNLPIMYVKNNEETLNNFLKLYDGEKIESNFLTMYVQYKNKSGKLEMVTTDNAKFYYDGKEIKSPYKKPILIIKLNNNEEFECTCNAQIGLNLDDLFDSSAIYDPVAGCAYKQEEENKFILRYESKQQFDELEILKRGLTCLIMRLEYLENLVEEKITKENEKNGMLNIPNEDMTLGGILGYMLQMHDDIKFAGDQQTHITMRTMQIRYHVKENSKKDIKEIFNEVTRKLIKDIQSIAKQLKIELYEVS